MSARTITRTLLALLLGLQLFALLRAPQAWLPAAITIRLAPGAALTAGRHELATVQGEAAHIRLRRDAGGQWLLQTVDSARPPVLWHEERGRRMASRAIAGLRTFQVGASAFRVTHATPADIAFTDGALAWRYDGATLYREGSALPPCADSGMATRSLALWNRIAPPVLTVARPLLMGGNLYCGNRLGMAFVPPGAATVARADGLRLAATDGDAAVRADGGDLRADEQPLAGVTAMTLGATRYELHLAGDTLTLHPGRRVTLYTMPDVRLPAGVSWSWQPRRLWAGNVLAWLVTLSAAMALAVSSRTTKPVHAGRRGNILRRKHSTSAGAEPHWPGSAPVLAAGIAALLLQRAGHPPAPACSLLLAGCALWSWQAMPGRRGLAGHAALLLLAAGTLVQLELGLAGPDSWWLRYYGKTTALLAIGSGAIALWRLWRGQRRPLSQRAVEWLLALAALAALALVAAQVLWGDETGVFDLQPVELAKCVLAALTAHCLALRMGWRADHHARPGHAARWLRLIAPALLFLALLGLALVQVDDYSPLILLLLWGGAMVFAYALAAGCRWRAALLACVALAGAGTVPALRAAGPQGLAALPGSFYADRFQVWLEPQRHPHTGQQLLAGASAIAGGGWLGADGLFGLATLGRPAGGVVAIPAVQDDFAPSFLLNRHGLLAALLLWCLQAALLAGLVATAMRQALAAQAERGFRGAWRRRLQSFMLAGGAAFLGGHFLLSWGTNLAILPVMGQPMSFLSAGGSHLLFFLLPLLGLHAAVVADEPAEPRQE